jgi:hypothetical protein
MVKDGKRTVEHFIAALSADGLKANSRAEFRLGYPTATDAELDILVAAEEKAAIRRAA